MILTAQRAQYSPIEMGWKQRISGCVCLKTVLVCSIDCIPCKQISFKMSEELFLTLGSVFSYLNCNASSRSIVEGEENLNSNHIILTGITEENEDSKDVYALCLQTSALRSCPHEIKGKLLISNNKVTISQFSCTCKAGLSGTCKHISAVLLKCTR